MKKFTCRVLAGFAIGVLLLLFSAGAQEIVPVWNSSLLRSGMVSGASFSDVDTLISKALGMEQRQQPDSAASLMTQALNQARVAGYPDGLALSLSHLGRIYFMLNKLERSKDCLYKAVPYLQQLPRMQKMLVYVYNALGTVYVRQGVRDSALTYYYRSLKVIEQQKPVDSLLAAMVYSNIGGGVFAGYAGYSGKKEQALYYLNLAGPIAERYKAYRLLGNICSSTALVMDRLADDTTAALKYYRRALEQYGKEKARADAQLTYCHLAALYIDRKYYEPAKPYLDSAIAIYPEGVAGNLELHQIWANYLLYKKDYAASLFHFNKAMAICDQNHASNFKLTLYYFRARLYSKMGLGQKAYEDQKRHSDLLDSLVNEQKLRAANEMEVQYRMLQKDKTLLQQQLQLKQKEAASRRKNLWLAGSITGALLIVGFLINRQRNRQRLLVQRMELERLNARIQGEDLERSRIAQELHDGVSVLLSAAKMNYTAIGKENEALAETGTYLEVMDLLNQTVQEVRSIAHNLVPEQLIQQSLPASIQAFCELIGKGHKLRIELLTYGAFKVTDAGWNYAVYRMVQELIHNVLKHARATEVLVQLTMHEDKLHLTVEDNGVGFAMEHPSAGIGLHSLRSRVEKMQGQLLVSSVPHVGTTVEIEIPATVIS